MSHGFIINRSNRDLIPVLRSIDKSKGKSLDDPSSDMQQGSNVYSISITKTYSMYGIIWWIFNAIECMDP